MSPSAMTRSYLLACDRQQSVLYAQAAQRREARVYSVYGHRQGMGGSSGFNGELPERATGHYLLGNGYRAYNPVLMRFNSPDSWSPFGRGGLNAYAYCVGDPVNRSDPTGHFSWRSAVALAGLGLSVLTMGAATPLAVAGVTLGAAGAGVDVAVAEGGADPALGWIGLGVGVLALGAGVAAGIGVLARRSSLSALDIAPSTPGRWSRSLDDLTALEAPAPSAMGLFGQFEGMPHIMERIVRSVPGDALVNLAATSRAMNGWVRSSVKRLPYIGSADELTVPLRNRLRSIAAGQAPGHLPSQVAGWGNLEDMASRALLPLGPRELSQALRFGQVMRQRRASALRLT